MGLSHAADLGWVCDCGISVPDVSRNVFISCVISRRQPARRPNGSDIVYLPPGDPSILLFLLDEGIP